MKFLTALAAASFALIAQAQEPAQEVKARFGPSVGTGKDNEEGTYIKRLKTTLHLPAVPSPAREVLVAWPGVFTTGNDIVQSIASSMNIEGICDKRDTTWCLFTYTLQCSNMDKLEGCHAVYPNPPKGNARALEPGTAVDFEYTFNESTGQWLQQLSTEGQVFSSLVSASGKVYNLLFITECQYDCFYDAIKVFEHSYTNTIIDLSDGNSTEFVKNFRTDGTPEEAMMSELRTSQDGARIEVDLIKFFDIDFPAQDRPKATHKVDRRAAMDYMGSVERFEAIKSIFGPDQ